MSAVVLRGGRAAARAGGGLLLGLLGFGLGLVLMLLIGASALVWRLNQGPLDVTPYAQRIEARWAPGITTDRIVLSMLRVAGRHMVRLEVAGMAQDAGVGRPAQSVRSATITISLRGLIEADFIPAELVADGLRLHVTRPPVSDRPATYTLRRLDGVQHVSITDAQIVVDDPFLQTQWQLAGGLEMTRQADGDLQGTAELDAKAGDAKGGDASTHLALVGALSASGVHLEGTTTALSPAALGQAVPGLSGLAVFDAPVVLKGSADLDPAFALQHASLHAEAGPGFAMLPAKGGGTSPGRFAALTLDADGDPGAIALRGLHVVLAPASANPPSNIVVSGTVQLPGQLPGQGPGKLRAQLALDIDQASLSDLNSLWPEHVAAASRPWLVENLTAGTAHDGHFTFTIEGASPSSLAVTSAGGQMLADEVTVWWLRPVPPIEHAHAVLTFLDPDTVLITGSKARTGNLVVRNATMRITGMSVKDQVAVLSGDASGPVPDLLTLLAIPRLGLLSKRPLHVTNPTGTVSARVAVNLPLENKLTIDQVAIHVTSKIADAHLGGIAGGKDLDHIQAAVEVTNEGLKATGAGLLSNLPTKLDVAMDFHDGPPSQVLQHVVAAIQMAPADARAAGLGVVGLKSGTLSAIVDYSERRDATATLKVDADLTDGQIETPIGWSKPAGAPGHAGGQANLDHNRVVGLDGITASGPGLAIVARSEMVGGAVSVVHIDRGEIGRSSATGSIGLPQQPGQPYRITLSGPQLDLEGRLNGRQTAEPPPEQSPGPAPGQASSAGGGVPYVVDLRFDRVRFGADQAIGPVAVTASGTGRQLTVGHVTSRGPEQVEADLAPGVGERKLYAVAANLGLLLRQTGVATELEGGRMSLQGVFNDRLPGSPLSGTLELADFRVRGAPVGGKVLQALTVYGIADALQGPGLAFDRLVAPFRINGGKIDVKEARAFSNSLGVTATGMFDFDHQTLALDGTIVPAYLFNALPGRVPFLGKLFSPETGSGIFAATYGLRGPVSDPSISFNPLSALTPGFLRGIFQIF